MPTYQMGRQVPGQESSFSLVMEKDAVINQDQTCCQKHPLAAEALSLADGCESAFNWVSSYQTQYGKTDQQNKIQIRAFVDNKSLAYSTTMVSEKRLPIEMTVVYEMIKENKVSVNWIEARRQLSDSLTKQRVLTHKLNVVLSTGKICD